MTDRSRQMVEVLDALNRADLDAFLGHIADDAEFRSLIAESEGEVFRGHDGVRSWWRQVREALGGMRFELLGFWESGRMGVAKLRVSGSIGGTTVEQVMWQAVIVDEDDKGHWWGTYRSEEEAHAALAARPA